MFIKLKVLDGPEIRVNLDDIFYYLVDVDGYLNVGIKNLEEEYTDSESPFYLGFLKLDKKTKIGELDQLLGVAD